MTRILLVHGALADGSSWTKAILYLQDAGFAVTAVQQPLTSIEDDIKIVKAALKGLNDASSEPIVVVGHSFGGLVITNAVTNTPNIKALVYVQAFAPDEDEAVSALAAKFPNLPSAKNFIPEGSGRLVLSEANFLKYFAPDVADRDARVLAATQGPCDAPRFDFVCGKPAWKQIKNVFYIVGEKDQIIHPELQAWFAERMGAKTYILKGASHAGLISQGDKVAKVIIEAAAS
jgi:pimeloyl-ACP methyl ester carboxylesterase